jgi:uncharacterized protein (DUF58 family)
MSQLPPEILKKVKLLEISTRKLVNNIFAGEYHSAFRGQGMTFSEFREYVPGDDVRNISWTLTARAGKPFIKKYDEERELTLILAVDISGSGDFGTGEYFKGEVITYLSALLSFSAVKNNDQIGLLLFSDQIEHYVPPKKGRPHVHRILRDLFYYKPKSRKTDIGVALEHLRGVLKRKSHIFILSDFMDENYAPAMRTLGKKHDVVAVVVEDQAERELPNIGVVDFHDAETGQVFTVDTSSKLFQRQYAQNLKDKKEARDRELRRAQIDCVEIVSGQNFVDPLIAFFQRRHRR